MSAAFRVEARELKKFKNVILLLEEIKEREKNSRSLEKTVMVRGVII
jgi:hypothetical protein